MRWLRALGVFGGAVAVLGAAACGGDDYGDDSGSADDGAGSSAAATTLKVTQDPKLGAILTNSDGLTLYVFTQDSAGKSACNDACAKMWPAVPVTDERVASPYSTITRDDGTKQLAYKGKPLYLFAKDTKPGERKGDKMKDVWHVVAD